MADETTTAPSSSPTWFDTITSWDPYTPLDLARDVAGEVEEGVEEVAGGIGTGIENAQKGALNALFDFGVAEVAIVGGGVVVVGGAAAWLAFTPSGNKAAKGIAKMLGI